MVCKYVGGTIPVVFNDNVYQFEYVLGTFADITPDKLVIAHINKKKTVFDHLWVCNDDVSYEIQDELEKRLVGPKHPWFNKSFSMFRLTSCDENSFSITCSDKTTLSMVRMGDKFYATKPS